MSSLRKPKRPKYKALPKAPKMSASVETWKRYETRLKSVMGENLKRKNAYESAFKSFNAAVKMRERIKEIAKTAKSRL